MIIAKKYVMVMDNRRAAFHRALRYFIDNGKNITQTRISKATGIKQGMISGMKTGKRYGTEDSRREIANFFGQSYDDFIKTGQRLIEAENKAGLSGTLSTTSLQATASGQPITLSEHQKMVTRFKDKEWGESVNSILLEIEDLDPDAKDEITGMLREKLKYLRKKSSSRRSPQASSSAS